MKVFLDIDGVMVRAASWKTPENLEDGFPMFSQKAIKALIGLISDGASIILTTSHKYRFTIDGWKKIFERRGIKIENLSRLDVNESFLPRKDEILRWFNINSVDDDFIIIDDDTSLYALPSHLKERMIITSPLVGLTCEHLIEAKSILGSRLQLA